MRMCVCLSGEHLGMRLRLYEGLEIGTEQVSLLLYSLN